MGVTRYLSEGLHSVRMQMTADGEGKRLGCWYAPLCAVAAINYAASEYPVRHVGEHSPVCSLEQQCCRLHRHAGELAVHVLQPGAKQQQLALAATIWPSGPQTFSL